MRNTLLTPFWQAAHRSLPEAVRCRYLAHFERAERWELALDMVIGTLSRARSTLSELLSGRRSAHANAVPGLPDRIRAPAIPGTRRAPSLPR
jgi:hypothetical protein